MTPIRKWTIAIAPSMLPIYNPAVHGTLLKMEFVASTQEEAEAMALGTLGVSLEPCCDGINECPACYAESAGEAVDRLIDQHQERED